MAVASKLSSLVDTRVFSCEDNLEQLKKFHAACVDIFDIDPPIYLDRNFNVLQCRTKEMPSFEDPHENSKAFIDYIRLSSVERRACSI